MSDHLKKTVKQLLSLTMFCKRVQIPFEVYSFRTTNSTDYDNNRIPASNRLFTNNPGELDFDNFIARNLLSSRMNIAEFNDAMFHMYVMGCGGHLPCDSMGSTPLNECIGTADLIVNRFKARSKVQIVNTIFLTDGESDPISCVHGLSSFSRAKRKYIVQDEITKKNYDLRAKPNSGYYYTEPYAARGMTSMLLRILKDRIGGNLIGFYLTSYGFDGTYRMFSDQYGEVHAKARSDWKTNGFFGVTNAGYDEYYILNPKTLDVTVGNLSVNSDMTRNKAAKEFIKFVEKKSVSRVLLSRFVKRIAA